MKTLRNIFGNVWVLPGLAAFAMSLAIVWRHPGFGRKDAIGGLIIFGIIFPLLAWMTTLRAGPLVLPERRSAGEISVSGIFFGTVWGRTKNLFAVVFIHAASDLLPNFKEFVQTWGI